ncbi:hypothetical protein [Microcella flavibacter]|uniref:hypothetical protein n=1 Tax=Microcella flavibacter TaxID=1804990 RepID=UPI0014571F0B|nr:hypothetical protein [Microcella flavibacter]
MTQDAAAGPGRPTRPLVLDADGGTALAPGADPFGERRPPRIPLRLLVAALVAVLLLTGSAFGTRAAADVDPTAFAIFDRPATEEDEQALVDLAGVGAPVIGEARVLSESDGATVIVVRAPEGTGARLRDSGGYPLSGGPVVPDPVRRGDSVETVVVPDTAEACLWVVSLRFGGLGRCKSPERFAREGLAAAIASNTLQFAASWSADGAIAVQSLPIGPTTRDELRALAIPAIEQLESLPLTDSETRGGATADEGRFSFGDPLIELRQVAVSDEWRMAAGVFQPEPTGGLAACVVVEPIDSTRAEAGAGCGSIERFTETGLQGGLGLDGRTVTWEWLPDGSATFGVEE